MKNKIAISLIALYVLVNIAAYTNYFLNKMPEPVSLKCKVISMGERDKVSTYKGRSTSIGTQRAFIVHNDRFGYAEVPVTVNTFMTTKVSDTVTFDFSDKELDLRFHKDLGEPWYIKIHNIVFMITLLYMCLTLIALCFIFLIE